MAQSKHSNDKNGLTKYNDILVIICDFTLFVINCTCGRILYGLLYVYLFLIFLKQLFQCSYNAKSLETSNQTEILNGSIKNFVYDLMMYCLLIWMTGASAIL